MGIVEKNIYMYALTWYHGNRIKSNLCSLLTGISSDFYFFLQVEQIQAEYKKLALELHPDKNSGDKDAEGKFQKIQVIFQCDFYFTVNTVCSC